MGSLYENIAGLCAHKKISINKMCMDLNMRNSVISDLKTGRKKGLNAETLNKIASYFDVSVDFLLGNIQKEKPTSTQADELSEVVQKIVQVSSTLPEEKQLLVLELIKSMKQEQ